MGQLQEVRSCFAGEQARVASLRKELSDTERELGEVSARVDRQVRVGSAWRESEGGGVRESEGGGVREEG